MLSILIPSRNELFLPETVEELLKKAKGEIEIIVHLDGYWPDPPLKDDPRVRIIHRGKPHGMRPGINAAAAIAKGKYVMKIDAHCMVDEGFDLKLAADCDDDWVVMPRRKRLDAENWAIQDVGKPDIDYMYLSYPDDPGDWGGPGLHGRLWNEKNKDPELKKVLIDDAMSGQGSSWFMPRDYFNYLELMDTENYGGFWKEMQEIGLKCWLSGGRMIRNKKTWYAHLHKGKKYGRGYRLNSKVMIKATSYINRWLIERAWHKQTKDFEWLIDHFWPVPGWPEDWKEQDIWQVKMKAEKERDRIKKGLKPTNEIDYEGDGAE